MRYETGIDGEQREPLRFGCGFGAVATWTVGATLLAIVARGTAICCVNPGCREWCHAKTDHEALPLFGWAELPALIFMGWLLVVRLREHGRG